MNTNRGRGGWGLSAAAPATDHMSRRAAPGAPDARPEPGGVAMATKGRAPFALYRDSTRSLSPRACVRSRKISDEKVSGGACWGGFRGKMPVQIGPATQNLLIFRGCDARMSASIRTVRGKCMVLFKMGLQKH